MSWNKEKEVLINIVEMYKDMPYLWHKNHADYKNKCLREDGFRVLLEIYRNFNPDADIKTIKKKLENMRTTYLKEEKKVNASKQAGAGPEDVYVPTLWYYEAFSFLGSTIEACYTVRESLENDVSQDGNSSLSDAEDDISQQSTSSGLNGNKQKKRGLSLSKRQANIMETAEKPMSMKDEEWEILGKSIGLQLKGLNKRALTITQKLISDAIYYAKIGRLTEDSYIALESTNGTQNTSNYNPFPYHRSQSSSSFRTPSSPHSITPDPSSS